MKQPPYLTKILPNGLVISFVKTLCPELFRMELIVRAGGLDETREEIGFAHFIEHLMSFFPSSKYPNSLKNQKDISSKSIMLNAWTEPNTVGYYMEGLEKYRDLMIDYIMENYTDPILDPKVFEQERNAVISELSGMIGGPDYYMSQVADYVRNRGTNLSYTIEFEKENVRNNATLENIMTFRDRFYIPEMTSIFIASDYSLEQAGALIAAIQKKWFPNCPPKRPLNYSGNFSQPTLKSIRQNQFGDRIIYIPDTVFNKPQEEPYEEEQLPQEEQFEYSEIEKLPYNGIFYIPCDMDNSAMIQIQFPLNFDQFDDRVFYLEFVQTLLAGGLSSRLYYKLRSKLGAVYGVDADFHADPRCKGFSIFCISTDTSIKKLKSVYICILKELQKLIGSKKFVTSQEVEQFKNMIDIRKAMKRCSNSSSKWLKFYKPYLLWGKTPRTIDEVYSIQMNMDVDKVRDFCREIFDPDRIAVFYSCSEPVLESDNNKSLHYTINPDTIPN